ncbi:MAG: glycosyltransferase [bacterium]|nr:glycosyltransferase [bacterium]
MKENLVSVIIPIYNAASYLEKCIESVIQQTYEKLQIILINDGSTDNSLEICNKFRKKDIRIEVISTENEGVSAARNKGLASAKGQYLCFMDSDDYIETNMIERLYKRYVNTSVQLSICGFYEIIGYTKIQRTIGRVQQLDKEHAIEQLLEEESYRGYLWNKMFDVEIIKKHKICFDSSIKVWEDVLFVAEYLMYCNKIVYDPQPLYYYCFNGNSASHKSNEVESAFHVILAQEYIDTIIPKEFQKAHQILAMRVLKSAMDVCRVSSKQKNDKFVKKTKSIMKKYKKSGQELLTRKDKALCSICSTSTNAFCLLYELTHN